MPRTKTSITLSDDDLLVFARLRAVYGMSISMSISQMCRVAPDPFRPIELREVQVTDQVDAPEVQEAEHAA